MKSRAFSFCLILFISLNLLSGRSRAATIGLSSRNDVAIREELNTDPNINTHPRQEGSKPQNNNDKSNIKLSYRQKQLRSRLELPQQQLPGQRRRRVKKTKATKASKYGKAKGSSKGKSYAEDKQEVDNDFLTARDKTPSPSSAPSSTPRPTLPIETIDGINDATGGDGDPLIRTIRIENSIRGNCMSFEQVANSNISKVMMSNCTESESTNRWEILWEGHQDLFKIRHKKSQWCLPQNPEYPALQFNCFKHSGSGEALADSINGLVPCETPFAAIVGFVDASNPMYLYNNDCYSGHSFGTDVGLMSYTHVQSGDTMVLWGEKVLMTMPEYVSAYNLNAEWIFVDV